MNSDQHEGSSTYRFGRIGCHLETTKKVRKNSRITSVMTVKVISSLASYYASTLNNVSYNPCPRLRTHDVNFFIASSSSVLGKDGCGPIVMGNSHSVCPVL